MKKIFLLLLTFYFSFNLFSQINKTKDSTVYFIEKANYYTNNNNFKKSLFFAQKAIDLTSRSNDSINKSSAFATMGYIYYKINKYDEAIIVLEKSIKYYNKQKPLESQASEYYLIGLSHLKKINLKTAEEYFKKAENIFLKIKKSNQIELLNLQKGIVLGIKDQNELAKQLFLKIINTNKKNTNIEVKSKALYEIGNIEFKLKNYNQSIDYLSKSLAINDKDIEQKCESLLTISLSYENLGNVAKSYEFMKKHIQCKNDIKNLKYSKSVLEDYNQFVQNERIKEINQIDKLIEEREKSDKFSRLVSILAVAFISILSLLSLSLYKNNIIRNTNNDLLKATNSELFIAKNNAEKAMKARSDFLSTVSHELRTPLNAINGITHLLLEENPKKEQLDYLNSLKFSGNYLLTFVNEILEVNRIESSNIALENVNFNLKKLIENIQFSLKEIALENNNTFLVSIDKKIPDELIGDPIKLSQVILNLVNNSLKFTSNGKVEVFLKQIALTEQDVIINFRFTDTGIGIAKEKLATIFDSFTQGSIEINRKYGGTGLGLTIVKNLIEVLGGKIYVKSEINKGSEFYFDLKFKIDKNPVKPFKNIYNHKLLEFKKFLLVEDNKINQMVTKKMLENKKVICEIVENGEDAIEKVRNNNYDVVLMDVHLPGINGTTATKMIREFDNKTPIIALTAISLNENKESLLAFGMNEVITKPFDPENFYNIISQFV